MGLQMMSKIVVEIVSKDVYSKHRSYPSDESRKTHRGTAFKDHLIICWNSDHTDERFCMTNIDHAMKMEEHFLQ